MSRNGKPTLCRIPGCGARAHGNLLCRNHYDEERYEATTGRSPEARAAARREMSIEKELSFGCVSESQSPHGNTSMFESDEERRAAWESRRDKLMEHTGCGRRPWAWWEYESGRPELRSEPPEASDFSRGLAYVTRHSHLFEVEQFTFLAKSGHLTEAEVEKIAAEGREAEERIGTPCEQLAANSSDYGGDKLDAARASAVLGALKQ